MIKTWKWVTRLVKNSRFKGWTAFQPKMWILKYIVHDPNVILKSKTRTIIIIPTYGFSALRSGLDFVEKKFQEFRPGCPNFGPTNNLRDHRYPSVLPQ